MGCQAVGAIKGPADSSLDSLSSLGVREVLFLWILCLFSHRSTYSPPLNMYKNTKESATENDGAVLEYIKSAPLADEYRILKKNLTEALWNKYKTKATPSGGTLWDCLKSGKTQKAPKTSPNLKSQRWSTHDKPNLFQKIKKGLYC